MRILFLIGMTMIPFIYLLRLQAGGADVNFQRLLIMWGIFIAGYSVLYYFCVIKEKKVKQRKGNVFMKMVKLHLSS